MHLPGGAGSGLRLRHRETTPSTSHRRHPRHLMRRVEKSRKMGLARPEAQAQNYRRGAGWLLAALGLPPSGLASFAALGGLPSGSASQTDQASSSRTIAFCAPRLLSASVVHEGSVAAPER